ncbi:MAG: TolC family protein [Planctomycetota bacterium]|jgi:outer membrane protein TolC
MRILTLFGVLGPLLLIAGLSSGEEPTETTPANPEPSSGAPPPSTHAERALSVQDAIAMSIENNLDVQIARFQPLISDFEHTSAWGTYDPQLFGNFDYASTETPVATALQAGDRLVERKTTGAAGVLGLIPKLGAEYEISYGGQRSQSTSSIQALSPEYRATLLGSLTVPLLKGAWWGEPWVAVRQTGIGAEIADVEFSRALMDITRGTRDAYWNVAATDERRRVARKSLEARRALLEQTEAQYEVGVVSKVEVTEAEAGVAQGEVGVIVAENEYRSAQDTLIDVVLGPHLTPDSRLEIRPTDSPEEVITYTVDPEEANRKAIAHRPELASARKNVEQQEIELKFRSNQRLPKLDVELTYGYQGLSGDENPVPQLGGGTVGRIDRKFWDADNDWFSADGAKQWSGGAVVTIPIGNVSGRAGVSKARLELRRARTQLRRIELDIVLEVRDAIRDLESALEGIEAAERRRVAAAEQLRAEEIRLEHGESTPFDVLQREEDLVEAESQKIGALQLYHNSVTALDRAQGTILSSNNIVIEDAASLR